MVAGMSSARDRRRPGPPPSPRRRSPPRRSEREGVDEIQRGRMLGAIVELARERGVANVTVAHIVARSGVSRRTFYELFDNLEECFLAAFDQAVAQASVTVLQAYAQPGKWREKVKSGLTALLEFLEDEPGLAALMIIDALGAGTKALERRANVLATLIDTVDHGRNEAKPGKGSPSRLTAEGVVGSVFAVLHARLLEPDPQPFTALLNPLMAMIVLPYLGPAVAQKELDGPAPKARDRTARSNRDPLKDLDMRLTYRTVRVLRAIGANPGASNRQVAEHSGSGEPNAWTLTHKGQEVRLAIQTQTGD